MSGMHLAIFGGWLLYVLVGFGVCDALRLRHRPRWAIALVAGLWPLLAAFLFGTWLIYLGVLLGDLLDAWVEGRSA